MTKIIAKQQKQDRGPLTHPLLILCGGRLARRARQLFHRRLYTFTHSVRTRLPMRQTFSLSILLHSVSAVNSTNLDTAESPYWRLKTWTNSMCFFFCLHVNLVCSHVTHFVYLHIDHGRQDTPHTVGCGVEFSTELTDIGPILGK